ncbi:DUF4446 family protein [Anaerophilus nitritogenes]|uniref:DUF4446 family protein n=1 Tax=Anaerophilus nitritogenes TaxID=2498136 RepID=UPI00101BE1ED|nr:DUF4446 family protein [Anaerophilus nitritogenes]
MAQMFQFISNNMEIIIFYSALTSILLLILVFIQGRKFSRLKKKYERLSNNMEGKNIEEIIDQYYSKIDQLDIRMNNMDLSIEQIQHKILYSIQKVGIIQYNAFDDIGGTLSFSMALLDEQDNGILITSIYSRSNNVVYGKPIKKGKSSHSLSVEELQALDRAKRQSLNEYVKKVL